MLNTSSPDSAMPGQALSDATATVYPTPTSGRIGPAANPDTQFFWDGARDHRLLIQQCSSCGKLRHPPGPACQYCHSLDWGTTEISGRGALYSFTVVHHPRPAGFDGPALAVVVELERGVRLVSNLADAEPGSLKIGEPLEIDFLDQDEGYTLPVFRRPSRTAN